MALKLLIKISYFCSKKKPGNLTNKEIIYLSTETDSDNLILGRNMLTVKAYLFVDTNIRGFYKNTLIHEFLNSWFLQHASMGS